MQTYYEDVKGSDGSQSPSSLSASSRWKKATGGGALTRNQSFAKIRNSMHGSIIWIGEQAQTQFLDRNLEAHSAHCESAIGLRMASSIPNTINKSSSGFSSYNSLDNNFAPSQWQTIRFQVIVWAVGSPDVKNNRVNMKFRVTLYWNDDPPTKADATTNSYIPNTDEQGDNVTTNARMNRSRSIWVMVGRSAAIKKKISDIPTDTIDVPPVSILNADSFEVIGQPEVQLLREDSRLMRWSCMYRAQLHQDDMRVNEFPHDAHNLSLKLGILSQRQPGGRWGKGSFTVSYYCVLFTLIG